MANDDKRVEDHLTPDAAHKIHWAVSPLEEKVDVLRSRNWITEDLINFSQKHWHCSREQALERLVAQLPNN